MKRFKDADEMFNYFSYYDFSCMDPIMMGVNVDTFDNIGIVTDRIFGYSVEEQLRFFVYLVDYHYSTIINNNEDRVRYENILKFLFLERFKVHNEFLKIFISSSSVLSVEDFGRLVGLMNIIDKSKEVRKMKLERISGSRL